MFALLDCNSFYCSCERLFRPELDLLPVVVLSNNDGCVIARSDEAKLAGIKMGEPFFQCRDLIRENKVAVFSSNYQLYGELSMRVMDTLKQLSGDHLVEVYSVDEAFVNLASLPENELEAFGLNMKQTVELWTGIKVSLGIAPTKVLCKVANRLAKKYKVKTGGVFKISGTAAIREALEQTEVGDLWGIGHRYAEKLRSLGIITAWQLSKMPEEWMRKNMGGVVGQRMLSELNGIPCMEMKDPLEIKKMISSSRMFGKPVYDLPAIREAVASYTARAAEKLRRQGSAAGSVEVYLVNSPLSKFTYEPQKRSLSASLPRASSVTTDLCDYTLPLAESLFTSGPKYLKAGVIFSGLVPDEQIQGNLFVNHIESGKQKLMQTVDNINFSQGSDMIKFAASGTVRKWKMKQELMSPRYTCQWDELKEIS